MVWFGCGIWGGFYQISRPPDMFEGWFKKKSVCEICAVILNTKNLYFVTIFYRVPPSRSGFWPGLQLICGGANTAREAQASNVRVQGSFCWTIIPCLLQMLKLKIISAVYILSLVLYYTSLVLYYTSLVLYYTSLVLYCISLVLNNFLIHMLFQIVDWVVASVVA